MTHEKFINISTLGYQFVSLFCNLFPPCLWFGGFYGTSTLEGYLMLNPVYTNISVCFVSK